MGSLMWPTVYISTVYISDLFYGFVFSFVVTVPSLYTVISIS